MSVKNVVSETRHLIYTYLATPGYDNYASGKRLPWFLSSHASAEICSFWSTFIKSLQRDGCLTVQLNLPPNLALRVMQFFDLFSIVSLQEHGRRSRSWAENLRVIFRANVRGWYKYPNFVWHYQESDYLTSAWNLDFVSFIDIP